MFHLVPHFQYDSSGRDHAASHLGPLDELIALLGKSTAYVERSNLTTRLFNGRLTRKTLAFSKDLEAHRAAVVWEDAYYNFVRPYKSLREEAPEGSSAKWIPVPRRLWRI